MLDQTNRQRNEWAAWFLGWKKVLDDPDVRLWSYGWHNPQGHIDTPPDVIHDLGACRPLLKKMNEEVAMEDFWVDGWDPVSKDWVCFSTHHMKRVFHSPESEPGGCIVKAAMYVFGKERDD